MTEIVEAKPQFICNTVRSCKQKYHWDCGVACVLAVLGDDSYNYFSKNFQSVCKEESFNKSTWTIDLCYLLKRFEVKHVYYTKTVGINPDYREHDFYHRIISKEINTKISYIGDPDEGKHFHDSERVIERFESAQMNGITIVQQEIDMYQVIRHVYLHGPVILLTDANTLTCDDCKIMRFNPGDFKCFPSLSKLYHGHFVIVIGYDLSEHKVFYRNPCFKQRICTTSFRSLDSAWKHEGTDQDAIFIHHYNMESS